MNIHGVDPDLYDKIGVVPMCDDEDKYQWKTLDLPGIRICLFPAARVNLNDGFIGEKVPT